MLKGIAENPDLAKFAVLDPRHFHDVKNRVTGTVSAFNITVCSPDAERNYFHLDMFIFFVLNSLAVPNLIRLL